MRTSDACFLPINTKRSSVRSAQVSTENSPTLSWLEIRVNVAQSQAERLHGCTRAILSAQGVDEHPQPSAYACELLSASDEVLSLDDSSQQYSRSFQISFGKFAYGATHSSYICSLPSYFYKSTPKPGNSPIWHQSGFNLVPQDIVGKEPAELFQCA